MPKQKTLNRNPYTLLLFYYHTDHLGSASYITDDAADVVQQIAYLPYGEDWVDIRSNGFFGSAYKFNGYEKDPESGLYYAGARYQVPRLGSFNSTDPLWWKSPDKTSYHYCSNNPVMRVDPNGRDDYKLDKKTGEVAKVATTADSYDRILKSNRKGEIITNKYGSSEVAIDNIPKGILKDNMNLRTEDNLIYVGAEGQPTLSQVEEFMYNLSNYVEKEILSIYYSKENKNDAQITAVYLDGYNDNTLNGGRLSVDDAVAPQRLLGNTFAHTHILIDRYNPHEPSDYDIDAKKTLLGFGVKNFLIITREYNKSRKLKRIKY